MDGSSILRGRRSSHAGAWRFASEDPDRWAPEGRRDMRKTFAAVLLAGGRSTRMKTNKAFLDFHGIPMWRFQMEKLERLGPDELFFSVQPGMDFPPGAWRFVCDRRPDFGPLG